MISALDGEVIRLRAEKRRTLVYKRSRRDGTVEKHGLLHPVSAIALTLFDGKRTDDEVSKAFRFVTDLPTEESAAEYLSTLKRSLKQDFGDETFLEVTPQNKHRVIAYDPAVFIVKNADVDLTTRKLDAPLGINYLVTEECNRKCIYCFAERDESPKSVLLPLSRYTELIDEARNLQMNDILFSGGEPFLRKDIVDIIGYAIKSKLSPIVSTKSRLSHKTCGNLADQGLERIQVSLDSADPDTASYMTGCKDFVRQSQVTIKHLQDCGVFVKVKAVVTPYNMTSIPRLLKLLRDWNITEVQLVQYGRSVYRHTDSLFLDRPDIAWLWDHVNSFREDNPNIVLTANFSFAADIPKEARQKLFDERALCSMGKLYLTILPDGRALACEQLPTRDEFIAGDLTRQSIENVWHSARIAELVMPSRALFRDQPCFDCGDFEACHQMKGRCMRDAYNVFGNPYAPDPRCPKAPTSKRLI